MKPTHIIALISRLFAIALLLVAIRDMAAAIWVVDDPVATRKLIPLYAACATALVAAALLWLFPMTLANKIYPVKFEKLESSSLSVDELYQLGFIILGMFLLFYVLSDAVYWLTLVILGNREAPDYNVFSIENKAAMLTTSIEFLVAMLLIFRANGIASVIRKLRQA